MDARRYQRGRNTRKLLSVEAGRRMTKPCPRCKTPVATHAKTAPFCSSRCQMADLGSWLTESYRIPAETDEDDEDGQRGPPTMPPPDGEQ